MMPTKQPQLVMGELISDEPPRLSPLDCAISGVTARQTLRRGQGVTIQERLYECANGYALGARRGGPLHLADGDTWEIFTLNPQRTAIGEAVSFVDEVTLERAVRRLAAYRQPWQSPAPARSCSR